MQDKPKRYRFCQWGAVLCAVLFVLFWCGRLVKKSECPQQYPLLIQQSQPYSPYAQTALAALSGYQISQHNRGDESLYHQLALGNVVECFDVQALPAIEQGVGEYWYPQCSATVVIAIDRAQTNMQISGWKDMLDSGLKVSWNGDLAVSYLVMGAFFYGMEGEDFTMQPSLQRLKCHYQQKNMLEDNWMAPVQVCFDFQAVELNRQGRNLDIIVPEEGTLTYQLGLLSQELLEPVSDDEILKAGLRLTDGRAGEEYPPLDQYKTAAAVTNYDKFLYQLKSAEKNIRRQVQSDRIYSSADGKEHVIVALLGIIITLIWMGTAAHRSIRPDIQRAIQAVAVLTVCWLGLRLFKYQILNPNTLNRYCWYSYYIFQMGLPTVLLYLASILDRPQQGGRPPRWFWGFVGFEEGLLLTIFTNDIHRQVFRFQSLENWESYRYGFVYYLVYLYCALTFLISIFLLAKKSWDSPKRVGWCFPVLLGIAMIGYSVGYAMNIPIARDSDFTMTFCFFALMFVESSLRTGLIPANTQYDSLFSNSPLNMQLLDDTGKTVLAAVSAEELEPVTRVQLQASPRVCISKDENTLLMGRAIHQGTIVWQEDITALNQLGKEIEASVEKLETANALLRQEGEIRRRKLASEVKAQLFNSLEEEIREKTQELSKTIRELPQAADKEKHTAYLAMLLCHIKRRCNLFFLAEEGKEMSGEELSIYLDELSEFAGYAGVRALTRCGIADALDIRIATLCYDFYFTLLSWSARESGATLLGQLERRDGELNFRVLSSEEEKTPDFPPSFLKGAAARGGKISCRQLDETIGIYLTFSKGGSVNG